MIKLCDNQNWLNAVSVFNSKNCYGDYGINSYCCSYVNSESERYLRLFEKKGKVYDAKD